MTSFSHRLKNCVGIDRTCFYQRVSKSAVFELGSYRTVIAAVFVQIASYVVVRAKFCIGVFSFDGLLIPSYNTARCSTLLPGP